MAEDIIVYKTTGGTYVTGQDHLLLWASPENTYGLNHEHFQRSYLGLSIGGAEMHKTLEADQNLRPPFPAGRKIQFSHIDNHTLMGIDVSLADRPIITSAKLIGADRFEATHQKYVSALSDRADTINTLRKPYELNKQKIEEEIEKLKARSAGLDVEFTSEVEKLGPVPRLEDLL